MNKEEAVRRFAGSEFNNIPLSLVEKAYPYLFENIVPLVEPQPEDYGLEDEYEPEFDMEMPVRTAIMPSCPSLKDYPLSMDFNNAFEKYRKDMDDYGKLEKDYAEKLYGYRQEKTEYEELHKLWEEYDSAHNEWESENEDYYPMWGTLFECDNSWISSKIRDNIAKIQEIGFIVLDDFEELNVCLGVNGCGYDFYDAHWRPLYDFLGMQWHSEEKVETNAV